MRRSNVSMVVGLAITLIAVVGSSGCATPSALDNLGEHKILLIKYYASGAYLKDIRTVSEIIITYLDHRIKEPHDKAAIVFDIDETVLSNWEAIRANDFGYVKIPHEACELYRLAWNCLEESASAPPIEPILEVYRHARSLGIEVFFISARPEAQRSYTEDNLRKRGYSEWNQVILSPNSQCFDPIWNLGMETPIRRCAKSVSVFKAAERKKLIEQGWQIIANVGDQPSDLEGGYAEETFQIPNPFYRIP